MLQYLLSVWEIISGWKRGAWQLTKKREYFSEIFQNLQEDIEETVRFLHVFKRKFSEIFWNFQRVFLGKIPGYFYFWKKITLFLFCGTRRFMDCKEYFHGNCPVISCLEKNISGKLSSSVVFRKEYFQDTFPCFSTDEAKNIFMETFRFFHVNLSQKLSRTVML